ncbi:glycoside hydrolase family 43 protein [Sphaerimonospora mesophila]|uniref:glycoside hydrolase family 43 protein n=1 Tax=Sphaerimonospora mesophila TaxID=37483 RepID=UPI000A9DF50B
MRRHRWHGRLPIVAALASLLVVVLASGARAANPIIDTIYTADPAALVVGDTMYIYAGHDEAAPGAGNFYMRDWHVLSSTDAAGWTDNGAKLSVADFAWAGADAWAGEVEPRNGKYYWYVPVNGNGPGWMDIGVAVGDTPLGPFRDAKGGPLISDGTPNSSPLNIDPTVFTDDDGQAYIYWGGYWGVRAAKLKSNMIELDGPVIAPTGLADYWEAPWMFKRNGVYYMVYAANDTNGCVTSSSYACQRYATASNPLGPWTQRGVILDRVSSTTSHAAVVEFKGQWYMVYHTADAPGGGDFRRSVAVDRLYFNADGTIQKVVQTRGGASGANRALTATASTSYGRRGRASPPSMTGSPPRTRPTGPTPSTATGRSRARSGSSTTGPARSRSTGCGPTGSTTTWASTCPRPARCGTGPGRPGRTRLAPAPAASRATPSTRSPSPRSPRRGSG